jgi:hypothetical protein
VPYGTHNDSPKMKYVLVSCTISLPLLLGCAGGSANAGADATSSADDAGTGPDGTASTRPPGFPPGADASPPPLIPNPFGDGGCTTQASSAEGDCVTDEDCLGSGGTLPCINGKCPPFCNTLHFTDVQNPPDGSVRCARLSGPVDPDGSYAGPARWCVPPQTCTPYDGQWGCCMSVGPRDVMCVSSFEDGGTE